MAKPKPSDVARAFLQDVQRAKEPAPIYLVHGEECYLLDRAVHALVKLAAPDGLNDFNYDAFHGKEVTGEQLFSAVETLPFMCKRRVVLVRELQEMDVKTHLAAMEEYFVNPSPSTCLIFHAVTSQKKLDGRLGPIQKLKKAAVVAEFAPFYTEDAERFAAKQAHDRGMRLDDAALAHLIQAVGTQLAGIDQALNKIDLYLGPDPGGKPRQVTQDIIHELIADTREHSVFDLTDALGDRDLERAFYLLDKMLIAGQAPLMITQMITRHFRILAKLHDPSLRSAQRNERASSVGVSPFFLKDYERHALKFAARRVEAILELLVEVDHALKSSRLSDRVHLERLVLRITH